MFLIIYSTSNLLLFITLVSLLNNGLSPNFDKSSDSLPLFFVLPICHVMCKSSSNLNVACLFVDSSGPGHVVCGWHGGCYSTQCYHSVAVHSSCLQGTENIELNAFIIMHKHHPIYAMQK